ncbi:MAG: beta-N-acetylhexosaminidase [Reichenbachiella sp.]
MHHLKNFIILIAFLLIACKPKIATDLTKNQIIPKPVEVIATTNSFEVTNDVNIYYNQQHKDLLKNAEYLRSKLSPSTGYSLEIIATDIPPKSGFYLTLLADNNVFGDEGYELDITEKTVTVVANKAAGIFHGIQTIRHVLPDAIEASSTQSVKWVMATGKIFDYPKYEYRGSMLDVSRHFFGVDDVKRYIDFLADLKMNVLHLHLTDDQGWRIEIKSWPNLTTHGGKTEVGGGKGGFYTQEQYKSLVAYAEDRYITIIPEIDVPSHTFAALSSYPELNCNGKVQKTIVRTGDAIGPDPYTGTEVGFCTLCTDKEIVIQFMNDVIGEIAAITPGKYMHIGGDESHVTELEDYILFIEKVQKMVLSNDKVMIGWDEIAHAKLDTTSIVQYWAKKENALMGVNQGTKVIVSPAKFAYLDMQYDSTSHLGLNWAGYTEVDSAYLWNPENLVEGIERKHILGIEAPLWSETIENMDDIEYLVYPRLIGHAEIGWSQEESRNWDEYKQRLSNHAGRMKWTGIDYYKSPKIPWNE